MKTPQNPHDGLFKITFSDPENVRDYLRNFLPQSLAQNLELDTLTLLPNSFISPKLEAFYSDLIYQCHFGEDELLISLLFEHKSTPQKYLHIQLLRYMVSIWEAAIKQNQTLLPIIPIIVYQGKKSWLKRDFVEYFGESTPLALERYLPLFDYHLTDLADLSDESLQDMDMGFLYNTFLLMKHYGEVEYIRKSIHRLFTKMEYYMSNEKRQNQIEAFLVYLISTTKLEKADWQQLIKSFPMEIKNKTLTVYEQILEKRKAEGISEGISEGLKLGRIEGKMEAANKMISAAFREGLPVTMIAKIADLSISELKLRLKELGLSKD